jgi:DNA-binding LytR/AlgR family response regulator
VREVSENARVRIRADEIVVVESYGHDIIVHTEQSRYKAGERLYQMERLLDPRQFLRISHSVIVARDKIKRITPALSSKFVLSMTNGMAVDVTRSYYAIFKDRLQI